MNRILGAQVKHLYYDFYNRRFMNVLLLVLFVGVYGYLAFIKGEIIKSTNFERILIYNYFLILVVAKIIISGFNNSFEVIYTEYNVNNLACTYPIINTSAGMVIVIRLVLRTIKATVLSMVTIILLAHAGGLITDIKNYIVLSIPVAIGMLVITVIGHIVAAFLTLINAKKELTSIIQVIMIITSLSVKGADNYFVPLIIIRNKITGILMSDIVYYETGVDHTLSIWWYWIVVAVISLLFLYANATLFDSLYHKTMYSHKRTKR